jgi:hypothetical protein
MLNVVVFAQDNTTKMPATTDAQPAAQQDTSSAKNKSSQAKKKNTEADQKTEEVRKAEQETIKAVIDTLLQAKLSKIEEKNEIEERKINELSDKVDSLKSKLFIAYGIAGLALLLAIGAIVLLFVYKKKFRSNLLSELETCEPGGRMDNFISRVAEKAKPTTSTQQSFHQNAKIDEQQFKQLFEACCASKQKVLDMQKQEQQRILQQQQNQPKSLYADAIIDDKFHRVQETADDSETNFELKLNHANDATAKVVVYQGAYRRILANLSFLDGCEKQLLSHNYSDLSDISMLTEGVAQKDSDGKWRITTIPKVKIS